jgi:DNA repair protein RadA/Sms
MKTKSIYICSECEYKTPKWSGKCSNCGAWNSFIEEITQKNDKSLNKSSFVTAKIVKLKDISESKNFRIKTNISELDRILGGGIIPGSIILVGGDPGIGKSTLMLQLCAVLKDQEPLYISGEESLEQIKFRSNRIEGIDQNLDFMAETNVDEIIAVVKSSSSKVVVIDSIQSVFTDRVESTPGSIQQVRECASLLMNLAKTTGKAIFIIGHVTKDGFIAGPKILEHLVDTVLQFEGDKTYNFRILRALKNRFGSTNEIGIFEMSESGLNEVKNPSEIFLSHRNSYDSGIAIVASIEGSRTILLEVQALVTSANYGTPQRTSNGFDIRRLQMILAVLEKRLGLLLRNNDVFINIAGGLYLNDPGVDLGIAAAIVSSYKDIPIDSSTVLVGEIGLTGEVRAISNIDSRISETEKLGFKKMIIPKQNQKKIANNKSLNIIGIDRISLALSEIL